MGPRSRARARPRKRPRALSSNLAQTGWARRTGSVVGSGPRRREGGLMSTTEGDQESYGDYSVDDEDQPSNIDGLGDKDVADELDRGYSPPERYSAGQGYGNTPWEESHRESIDQRVDQEEPEPDPYAGTDTEDDAFPADGEVGDARAGRLVGSDRSDGGDFVGDDIGIDGAAASA